MKYMRLFDQHSEYETYISSETADLPNVSWCINEHESHINPKDYSKEYLTFNILSGGTINWKASNTGIARTISYSKDSGETWTDITSSTAGTSLNVSAGETVMFKGNNSAYATSWTISNSFSGGTASFDAEGNIMSLIAGDNFETATTLSASYTFVGLFGHAKIVHARHLILPARTLADNCYWNMFFNCTSLTTAPELPATTLADSCYAGMFYGCTSLTATPELPATTLASGCYSSMFYGCTNLVMGYKLPATTLNASCYNSMFSGCRSLTTAPELPATTLDYICYQYMFANCTSLTAIPELPATTLTYGCYEAMFSGCTSLVTVPELPATTVAERCYRNMFRGCTNLTTAPELPATTLASSCYQTMFSNCTSLTTAPELPATTLADSCYYDMFHNCTSLRTAPSSIGDSSTTMSANACIYMFAGCRSLRTAPELPATTLNATCYSNMFSGCTNLTTAPELPATTLNASCYSNMFNGCASLTTAPELPATTLTIGCYQGMFAGCTSLTTAPELPATTLTTNCYYIMFSGCTNLNSITCLATDISATNCTTNWVYRVAASGTFTKADGMTSWTTGANGIPNGWNINNYYETQPLTLKTNSGEEGVFTLQKAPYKEIFYSIDNGLTWVSTTSTSTTLTASTVLLKSTDLAAWDDYNYDTGKGIDCSVFFYVQGNIMSLLYGDNYIGHNTITVPYAFYNLFVHSKLASASNLCMPATTLATGCYESMFYDCTTSSLKIAPELPATTLADGCYYNMFANCTSLTRAPELPATALTRSCYDAMFFNCTSLTTAPALPATTLAGSCYQYMFAHCTSLTTPPELPATTLASRCYSGMFQNCTRLTTAPELPATTLASGCYSYMFVGCTSLTTASELPATTLADGCYQQMFQNCTKLNSITCLATGISATNCTKNWVSGVAASGTFTKPASMTGWTTGVNGIPTNWTIEDYTAPTLEIWVDDFPYFNEIPDFVDDPEGMGSNKYTYYGTITRNNITYYTWASSDADAYGTNYNYLITTTNDYDTLYQDSLEYNVGSTFSTFVERANSDFIQNYSSYDGNDMYLIKVEYDQYHNLVLWVDDWAYGPKLMEEEIADPDSYAVCHYTHNGETFVYNGTTYYLWEMVNDNTWNPNVAYLLTSTNSPSALQQESLENGYGNTFDSFVTYLTEDSEEYQVSNEQYLVKIASNSNATLRVWVDDYPVDENDELDGEPVANVIQRNLNVLNANGNAYEYHGNTISYSGNTYYLWERNNSIGSDDDGRVPYLATSSVDYSTLQSQSLEDDYTNHFTCALGFLTEDKDEVYLDQKIGVYGPNGEYDGISLLKVEEIA